jgi:hypothetical protein
MPVVAHTQTASDGGNHYHQGAAVQRARGNPQPTHAPSAGSSPNRAKPESLGEKECYKDRQGDDAAEGKPAPIHAKLTFLITLYFSMSWRWVVGTASPECRTGNFVTGRDFLRNMNAGGEQVGSSRHS